MNTYDWEINITELASRVADKYGSEVAASAFHRFGATCFKDLNPAYYNEVFGDLTVCLASIRPRAE